MAILNRFSAILLYYCDSTPFFASRCGISGDSRPAILGIVRFAIRDSVPPSPESSGGVRVRFCVYGSKLRNCQLSVGSQTELGTQLRRQPPQSSSKGNFFVRVRFGGVPSTVEEVV